MTLSGLLYDLLVTATMVLAGTGLGTLALYPFRLAEPGIFGLWLRTVAGLGLLSMLMFGLGSAGLFIPLAVISLTTAAALLGLWATLRALRVNLAAGGPFATGVQGARGWIDTLAFGLFLLIAVTTLLWIGLTHSLVPPVDWDTISYHFALPKLYVEAGHLTYVPYMLQSNWPMNFEMLFALALLFGSDIAAQLTTLAFLGLIAMGLLLAGRRFLDDRAGALAAAIFCIIPLTKRVGGSGLIDPAMGLFTLGAAIAFERWRRERNTAWLILCGVFCGMSAGSKLMGGGVAILFGLLVLWEEVRRWWAEGTGRSAFTALAGNLLRYGMIIAVAGAVLVVPWYLRSYLNTGNPVWPFAFHVFGGRDWDDLGDEYNHHFMYEVLVTKLPRSPQGFVQGFALMLSNPEELGGYRGGVGLILPLGAVLALLLLPWAPRLVRHSLFVGGGFFLLWFAFVSHQLRFLMPVAPIMALVAAWAGIWLLDRLRVPVLRAPLAAGLVLVLLLEWPWAMQGERALFATKVPYLSGEQSRAAYLERYVDVLPLFRYANTELPSDSRLLLVPWETRGYYLDRDYIWGNPASQRIIPFEQYPSAEALRERLRELEITHILENPTYLYTGLRYWDRDRALMLELAERCGDTLIQMDDAALIALRDQCRPVAGGS